MKQNGFITTTNKRHYILLTEKRNVTTYMLAAMIRKMAETQNLPSEMAEEIMRDSHTRREFRKRIEPCRLEKCSNHYHIEVGKPEKPHSIINIPLTEKCVVVFEEGKPKPMLSKLYEEA